MPRSSTSPAKWAAAFSALCVGLLGVPSGFAQSLTGVQGLVSIPTARMPADGVLTAGFNYLNKKYLAYHEHQHHARSPYLSLGFLPFAEVSLRLTYAESGREEALGDRTASLRLRLLPERPRRPAVVVGVHDLGGSKRFFHAAYLVASKTVALGPAADHVSLHLGYGTRVLAAERAEFQGVFGGVALAPWPFLRILLEYDAEQVNGGVEAVVARRLHLLVAFTNFDAISGGAGFSIQL